MRGTGPGGGAESSFVAPDTRKYFPIKKTLTQGCRMFTDCATAPVGMQYCQWHVWFNFGKKPKGGFANWWNKEYLHINAGPIFNTKGANGERGLATL